jgi:hypothetical protein
MAINNEKAQSNKEQPEDERTVKKSNCSKASQEECH